MTGPIEFAAIAEELYSLRRNMVETNILSVNLVFKKNEEQLSPILALCPAFDVVLAYMLVLRLGWRVQKVAWTSERTDWTDQDCKRVG